MPKKNPQFASAPILLRAQLALGMSQTTMGELLGATRKTVARWQSHSHHFSPHEIETLAGAVHPHDPELAAEIAAHGGETLESLGIVKPAPPPRPPAVAPAPAPALPAPSLAHLVDAVMMAAVEANGGLSPELRPILTAAFERAQAMGLSVGDVAKGLRGEKTRVAAK